MEIKIENYLSEEEIKEIVADELRRSVRGHFRDEENAKRLLSNLAYHIVKEEVEKIVPDYEQVLVEKVASLIKDKDISSYVFDFDSWGSGRNKSSAAKLIERTVEENKDLIRGKVVEAIQSKDYSEEALLKLENLSENFTSNIYDFVELMKSKK